MLTLIDCFRTNTSVQMRGIIREQYRSSIMLSGCQIDESQPLVFNAVHLNLRHLDDWIRKTGTTIDINYGQHSVGAEKIQITCNFLESEVISVDIGQLELVFTYKFDLDPFRPITLTENAELRVQFAEPQPLQDAFKICTALKNLVTIGIDTPASIAKVSLTHSDFVYELSERQVSPVPIELYAQGLGDHSQSKVEKIHPSQMLFTFEDIGGLKGIAQWLKTWAKFEPAINSLLGHWYLPTIYTDNRLLNIIIAAETLERIRLGEQDFNLSEGLETLATFAGEPFNELVQDVKPWAKEIVIVRANNLVHRGLRGDIESSRMFWLSESLYFLVVFCLLRECGVAEDTLSNISRRQRFRMIAKQLQRTK